MPVNETQAECLKIPVVVGVTGHIDIAQDESWVLGQLEQFWSAVRRIVGPETPIVLLSSLARGADHYVVKSMPTDIRRYCAVLPFDKEEYEKDFTGSALEEFRQDLNGAYKKIPCNGQCDEKVRDYSVASDYVRTRSDILITLWDGHKSLNGDGTPKKAGTYHQIRTAFDMDDPLSPHQEKAHLIVNRTVSRTNEHKENEKQVCPFPEKSALNVINCAYNCDNGKWGYSTQPLADWVTDFERTLADHSSITLIRKIKNWIFKAKPSQNLIDGENLDVSRVLQQIRKHNEQNPQIPTEASKRNYLYDCLVKKYEKDFEIIESDFARYEYFDKQADGHQAKHKSQFKWIAVISFLVGICGQAWGDITFSRNDALHELILHISLALYLVGGICLFIWGRQVIHEGQYMQYIQPRVIAELMRLKMFWKLAGISDSFVEVILKDSANYWFAIPICNWDVWDGVIKDDDRVYINDGGGLPAVLDCWLKDQEFYYNSYLLPDPKHFVLTQDGESCKSKPFLSKKWRKEYVKKYERLFGYYSLLKSFFFVAGFVLAFILLVVYLSSYTQIFGQFDHTKFMHLSIYREFIVGICPFAVAILGWLLEKNNWDILVKQYRSMHLLFVKAITVVSNKHEPLVIRRLAIKELMLKCHEENEEWKKIKNLSIPEPMM